MGLDRRSAERRVPEMSRWLKLTTMLFCALSLASAHAAEETGPPRVGVSGDRFTLNGRKTFLLGVSYFDARSWHESDLVGLSQRGFNLVRCWLDWDGNGFFDAGGDLVHRRALLDFVRACGRHGMVVDATILDTSPT